MRRVIEVSDTFVIAGEHKVKVRMCVYVCVRFFQMRKFALGHSAVVLKKIMAEPLRCNRV